MRWLVLPAAAAETRMGDTSPSGVRYGEPVYEAEGASGRRAAFAFEMTDDDVDEAKRFIKNKADAKHGLFDNLPRDWRHLELL